MSDTVVRHITSASQTEYGDNSHLNKVLKKARKNFAICIDENVDLSVLKWVIRLLHWNIVNEMDPWDVYWTNRFPSVKFCRQMKRFQCINHFFGIYEICRKDLLARNLIYMQKYHPVEYDFFPPTWIFPHDYNVAVEYAQSNRNAYFILKPVSSSMGRGIQITKILKPSMKLQRVVCQLYMREPLLLDGYKFDLRVYVLLASIEPLQIFVYNEGLVRLSTEFYELPKQQNLQNKFMHLTNYSINKYSQTFSQDEEMGNKRTFESFNRLLKAEGHDVDKLWRRIDDVIVKTILSILPQLQHSYRSLFPKHDHHLSACFDIIGFDIIMDRNLKPFLLEVNQSPSLNMNTTVDRTVKTNLIQDTFNLLNISPKWKRLVLKEDRARALNIKQSKKSEMNCVNSEFRASNNNENNIINGPDGDGSNDDCRHTQTHENLGRFRELAIDRYHTFMMNEIRASAYQDTILSRTRAASGKQKREQIKNTWVAEKNSNLPSIKGNSEKQNGASSNISRKFSAVCNINAGYLPRNICYREETKRLNELFKRDNLIRKSGVVEYIQKEYRLYD